MDAADARTTADFAYREGRNILVYDMSTSFFGDPTTELEAGIEAIEREGFELISVVSSNNRNPMGVFRRRDDFRTQE